MRDITISKRYLHLPVTNDAAKRRMEQRPQRHGLSRRRMAPVLPARPVWLEVGEHIMTFPCELALCTTADGIRMLARPVREIELLHRKTHELTGSKLSAGQPVSLPVQGDLLDVRAEFAVGDAQRFGLEVGGRKIAYDAAANKLEGMPLAPVDGRARRALANPQLEWIASATPVSPWLTPWATSGSIPSESLLEELLGHDATRRKECHRKTCERTPRACRPN